MVYYSKGCIVKMYITIFPKSDITKMNKQTAGAKAVHGELIKIESKKQFLELITTYTWSAGIFKNNYRNNENFIKAYFMAFDIDDSLTLRTAIQRLKYLGFSCVIGTSTNHQKDKEGIIADRYRVIFPLMSPILNPSNYKATWVSLAGSCNNVLCNADPSCKDPARFFFPCNKAAVMPGFRKLSEIRHSEDKLPERKKYLGGEKGRISTRTQTFIEEGATTGQRHYEFILSIMDMKAQGYTKEEVKEILIPVMKQIKPEENAEYQINYIFDKYEYEFEYREKKEE